MLIAYYVDSAYATYFAESSAKCIGFLSSLNIGIHGPTPTAELMSQKMKI